MPYFTAIHLTVAEIFHSVYLNKKLKLKSHSGTRGKVRLSSKSPLGTTRREVRGEEILSCHYLAGAGMQMLILLDVCLINSSLFGSTCILVFVFQISVALLGFAPRRR